MRMLKWINKKYPKDRILNEEGILKINVFPIDRNMKESRLHWFGYIQRRVINALMRKSEFIHVERTKKKKKMQTKIKVNISRVVKNGMSIKKVVESMTFDIIKLRKRIHIVDPN